MNTTRPRIAVHKFASCDGCQLAFLNAGEALLTLAQKAEIVHFAEAGWDDPLAEVDIAFVEGSISTPQDLERIRAVRESARLLVTIGACATAGGLQALRNGLKESANWVADVYASPEYIQSLPHDASKRSQWLLTQRLPFTSLASGMVALTRVTGAGAVCVVASKRDPFAELAVIDVPAGGALVLQPR